MKLLTGNKTLDDLKLQTGEKVRCGKTVYRYLGSKEANGKLWHLLKPILE